MHTYKAESFIEGGLSMHVFSSTHDIPFTEHTHDFVEIIYALQGCCTQVVGGKEIPMRAGDLLFINYGSTHAFAPVGPFSFVNVCFKPEIISNRIITRENAFDLLSLTAIDEMSDSGNEGIISFDKQEQQLIEALLRDMLHEYNSDLPERSAVLESYMTVLIAKMLRKLRPCDTAEEGEDIWRKMSDYISENLDKKLTLSEIAGMCFYNPSYFSRAFKERFNMTLVDYIHRQRTDLAARLLTESSLPTSEISRKCGFGDKSSLYRIFSKIYGCTPSEYRAKARKNKI